MIAALKEVLMDSEAEPQEICVDFSMQFEDLLGFAVVAGQKLAAQERISQQAGDQGEDVCT